MTALSTPLHYPGSDTAIPIPGPIYDRSAGFKITRLALHLFVAASCLLAGLFVAFHAYAAYLFSYPPIVSLGSNPQLAAHLAYSDVVFPSADGKSQVEGWWIPAADSRKTVVLSHGYGTNREEPWVPMYDLAGLLNGMHYNVLMFDYGYADPVNRIAATGGVAESQQLIGALRYAREQGSDELVVWGFSMGAGTALQAALQAEQVDAMILDSTFLPDENTVYANIRNYVQLPKYPTVSLLRLFLPLMAGAGLDEVPSSQVQETAYPFPIFLIHGTADDKAPVSIAENVASAQTNELSRLWVVPDAIHEMIYRTHTEEYVARATAFLESVRKA
ncbi:alpha/beta hydrolase [Cohnella cellulosilytica]|uniref:Alpha/beta hydrolase n=1 Tax=Cohnella cellulosilytica TaxID=986710 RepID=A0ABW2FIZ2_9BACL